MIDAGHEILRTWFDEKTSREIARRLAGMRISFPKRTIVREEAADYAAELIVMGVSRAEAVRLAAERYEISRSTVRRALREIGL